MPYLPPSAPGFLARMAQALRQPRAACARFAWLAGGAVRQPLPVAPAQAAPAVHGPCLTHHEILGLAAPFVRSGLPCDLAASDRLARRLLFKPVDHPATATLPPLRETLQLDSAHPGHYRLTRRLCVLDEMSDGLQATLQAQGPQPEQLLAELQAVPAQHQFEFGEGWRMAWQHCLHERPGGPPAAAPSGAVLQTAALTLTLQVPALARERTVSADLELHAPAGGLLPLPDDLLAVLGWDWSVLVPRSRGWRGSVRLRAGDARAKLQAAARHLGRTLAEPPHRYHERLSGARFGVLVRRAVPLLGCTALAGAVALARQLPAVPDVLPALPLALLALGLWRSESARLEWPRWPRPSRVPAWSARR